MLLLLLVDVTVDVDVVNAVDAVAPGAVDAVAVG